MRNRITMDSLHHNPNARPQSDAPAPAQVMMRCGFKRGDDGRWRGTLPAFEALMRAMKEQRGDGLPRPASTEPAPVTLEFLATQAALEDLAMKIYGGDDD